MTPTDPTPLSAEELEALDAALTVVIAAARSDFAQYIDGRAEAFAAALGVLDPPLAVVPLATLDARELDVERERIDDIARAVTDLFNAASQGQQAHSRALDHVLATEGGAKGASENEP